MSPRKPDDATPRDRDPKSTTLEELLWELSRLEEAGGAPIPDTLLDAFRSGSLDEDESRRLERLLADQPRARRRLAQLSGADPPELPTRLREKVLAEVDRSRRTATAPSPDSRSWRFPTRFGRGWGLAAAAVLLVAVLGVLMVVGPDGPAELAPLPAVSVTMDGWAEIRSGDLEAARRRDHLSVTADEAVTVGVRVDPPRAGLRAALYLEGPGGARRLAIEPTWEDRGTAVFRAPARSLVGAEPGSYRLYAVVAWEGHLPASGAPLRELTGSAGLRVEPLTLEVIEPN